jgi:hypothetical protein
MQPDDLQPPALPAGQINFHPHTRLDRRLSLPVKAAELLVTIEPLATLHDERRRFIHRLAVGAVE